MISEDKVATAAQSAAEWLDRARCLAPTIEEYRNESERQRHIVRPLFEAIARTGILDMLIPRAFSGPQASICSLTRVVEELSCLDGSTGWNVMVWGGLVLFADYLNESFAEQIMHAGGDTVLAGSAHSTAQARPVRGGYEITGKWSFASGCHYATWMFGACTVLEGDQPRLLDNGVPERLAACIPAVDCEIIDTWHTAGLRGTGSHDVRVEQVFVPADRTFQAFALVSGPRPRRSTICRTPYLDVAAAPIAAVALGIARDAIDSFKALAAVKTPGFSTLPLAQHHIVQHQVGQAEALVRSSRAYLYSTLEAITGAHAAGAPITPEDGAALRLAAAHTAACAVEAVDLMFEAGGGSSVYESSRLERCFRDAHMVTQHVGVARRNIEMVGQYLLGGPIQLGR